MDGVTGCISNERRRMENVFLGSFLSIMNIVVLGNGIDMLAKFCDTEPLL